VTNTTKESRRLLLERIRGLGFDVKDEELFTSLTAARYYCEKNGERDKELQSSSAILI
jgi:ribonucleotide monophosphatase NagD (HAD superfamily)